MYIDSSTYTVQGKTYRRALLRNSYRVNGVVKHDTIANLSKCSDSEINLLKKTLHLAKNPHEIETKFELKQGLSVGAIWTLHQLAKELGIVKVLGNSQNAKLVLWMVYARLLGRGSRLSATRLMSQHAGCDVLNLESFTEEHLYKALDWTQIEQERIEKTLFEEKYGNKIPVFYLYDVTSSYLEGEDNELGDFGYNRDGKKSKRQIVIGLMTDAEGWPITVEVFQGNTNDTKTVRSQIRKVADRFGVKEVTFVGDRGMIKKTQIKDLKEEEFHYITAITKPEIESLVKKGVISLSLFDNNLAEIKIEEIRFIFRRNPDRAQEIEQSRQEKFQRLKKLCAEKNAYLKTHKKAKVETAIKAIISKAQKLKICKWINVELQDGSLAVRIDEEQKAEEMRLDGCYVLKTDRKKEELSTEEVHSRYKNLADVEWAFRTMKTTFLEMRGIFVRKEKRTRAHVFIVMLSYMIAYKLRRLWKDIDLTVEEGLTELSSINAVEVHLAKTSYQKIPQPRPMASLLLQKAGVALPDALPCSGTVVFTRKKLVFERKVLRRKSL